MVTQELNELTKQVIGCAFKVSNTLGVGFVEKVYENALAHEMRKAGLLVAQQADIDVYYDSIIVGQFRADFIIAATLLVELKAIKGVGNPETSQCLNYLKATGLPLCLLLNFGQPRIEIKRIVR